MLKRLFYRRWLSKQIAKRLLTLWGMLLLCAVPALSQNWSGILDTSRAVDWSSVGTTIANRTTICSTLSAGATAAQINSAIAACGTGQVVYLNAGTYNLAGGIAFTGKSNVTLRGAGPDQTILKFTAGTGCGGLGADVCVISNPANYIGDAAILPGGAKSCLWTAGYAQGATSITLNSCGASPPLNQFIILDQANDSADTGGVYNCSLGSCNNEGSTDTNGRTISGSIHSQPQLVYVSNVSGSGSGPYTVTISPGLYANNWRTGQAPGAWWPGYVSGDGIENMTVDHTNSPSSIHAGIYFYNAYNSWVKNVRGINSNRNQVWLYQSGKITVRDSYFYGTKNGAQESYGIEFWISSDCLIENDIFQHIASPIETENYSGSVVAHNYSIDDYFPIGGGNWLQVSYPNHGAGGHMNLFEGNTFQGLIGDDDWGTASLMTYFRNQLSGWETNMTMNTMPTQTWWGNRGYNFVGNVLGKVGYHTQYEVSPGVGSTGSCDKSIYTFGWRGTRCQGTSESLPRSTSMRWGNYDTVNAAVRWDATESSPGAVTYINAQSTPASHTLPASFYLSAKPSWWTTPWGVPPWPAIGPDVTGGTGPGGFAYNNPAQTCYNHTSIDSAYGTANVLLFNANNCYAATATSLVSFSPTSRAFGNQQISTTSSALTVTMTSAGTGTININSISVTGTNPTNFAQTNNCGASLASGASCTITITFTPSALGARSANIQTVTNASDSPELVPLTGTGTAPATSAVTFSPTSLAFGNQTTGTTSSARTITMTDTGAATLNITSINFTGTNTSDFAKTTTCGSTLAANASCTITITFTPGADGARSANVQTITDAPDSPELVPMTGTGTTPPAPQATLSPASLAFGNVLTGVTSASQAITLSNIGNASLTISSITLTGANSAMFAQTNTCGASVAAGGSCIITVTFTPTSTGAKVASVSVADNAAGTPHTAGLTGTGVAPAVTFGSASLAFGNQITNTTSTPQTVSLTNTGTENLTITSIGLTGSNPTMFGQTNNCPATLAAGNACTITVTFTPTSNGAKSANVSVTDNASGSPQTVGLTGTGVAAPTPLVTFSPTSVAFGSQTQSTTSGAYAITMTNSGSGTLTISNVTLIGTNSADFAQTNNCSSLTAGSSCTINVTFTPGAIGARSASVQTTTNAADSPETVAMTGTGTAAATPIVTFNHAVLNFGNQTIATPSTPQTVTLTNTGTATLTITSIAPAGTNSTDFSQTNDCGATLAASAFCTITVTFNPALTGQKSATIRTTTSAADSPENVNLTGNGIFGMISVPNSPTGFIIIVE